MEQLFCDACLPNSAVVRSHSLEIWISFSETEEFLEALRDHPDILRVTLAETGNPTLSHKALIFLVNVSGDEGLSGVLQGQGAVGALYRAVLVAMKKVDEAHLQVTQSLLKLAEDQVGGPDRVADHEVKKYDLSSETINVDSMELLLDLETVRLALMAMTNLAALSSKARKDVVQKGSVYEANNLLLLLDWVENPKTFLLFSQFVNVLLSLSSDEETQSVLLTHCLAKLMAIFHQRKLAKDFPTIKEMGKLFRNLSFASNNELLADGIEKSGFMADAIELIQESLAEEPVLVFGRFFVDIVLALLTSDKAGQNPERFKHFYEAKGLDKTLAQLKAREASQKYYQERIEALEHVVSSWH